MSDNEGNVLSVSLILMIMLALSDHMSCEESLATLYRHEIVDSFYYGAIVGYLLYLAVVTRLDIGRVLNRHSAIPICYSSQSLNLHTFTDSDGVSDKDLLLVAYGDGSWSCQLAIVSSMEVECIVCFFALQDVVWIRLLLKWTQSTLVHIDNRSGS